MSTKIDKKVLLMILDGWGNGDHKKDDVIFQAHPEYINTLTAHYPHAELLTSGEDVGLPDGQMGNSEVGHLNIGAGRVVYQDLVKINRACRDGSIMRNPGSIIEHCGEGMAHIIRRAPKSRPLRICCVGIFFRITFRI